MADDSNPHAHRFRIAAQHYLRGRLEYAPQLIADVALLTGLGRAHRVMDLGCGPGQLALAFAPLVAEVVALDPEPAMLHLAAARAREAGADIHFVQAGSNDLGREFGVFRLVTIGRAFHWMDRAKTLADLDTIVEPEGAVALFGDRHLEVADNAWREPYQAILRGYGAGDTSHPKRQGREWWQHEVVLLDSPFARLERIAVIERRHTPVGHFIDRALSQSSTAPDRLGDQAGEMIGAIETLMERHARDGLVTELVETNALIARRK